MILLFSFGVVDLFSLINWLTISHVALLSMLGETEHGPPMRSLMDLLASVITIAPALALALSGTSALPGVLALTSTKPVLGLVDVAVNHELSRFLVLLPVVVVERFLVVEELAEMVGESGLSGGTHESNNSKSEFHF